MLYTDGITYALRQSRNGLASIGSGTPFPADAVGAREAVSREVKAHIGGNEVCDDITLVMAKRR